MGANIQYRIKYSDVGPIFDKMQISDRREINFIKETKESRFTLTVDMDEILDNVLSELDFEDIAQLRADKEPLSSYNGEQISNYDEFKGSYSAYANYIGEKVLTDMAEYANDLADMPVFVETWV